MEEDYRRKLKKELDKTTDMLCQLCRRLPPETIAINQELSEWWQEHLELDNLRAAREVEKIKKLAIRKAAIAKLTEEELEVLGVE